MNILDIYIYFASRETDSIPRGVVSRCSSAVLGLLAKMSQMIVRAEFDSRILGVLNNIFTLLFEKIDGGKVGLLCDALGRLWLREVFGVMHAMRS
jgi:hypothetical protein